MEERLTRLRALVGRLERLPASPRREWMLAEARARVVDVESGDPPSGLRPQAAEQQPPPKRVPRQKPAGAAPQPRAPDGPPRAGAQAAGEVTPPDGLLWLDDPAGDAPADPDDDSPWRRGLRG